MGRRHESLNMVTKQISSLCKGGKTPYEIRHKCVPNLAGIQEFSVAAYVKDFKARRMPNLVDLLDMIPNPLFFY